nr:carboxylesterase 1C-like isoform X2 [Crassostrea virginica]
MSPQALMFLKLNIFALTWLACFVKGNDIVNAVEVKTPSGWIRGYEEKIEDDLMYKFLKIPYAKPPVGQLRFQKPQPIEKWEDVQGTFETSPGCAQWYFPLPGSIDLKPSEDCLYLNVYVPGKISTDRNLSVMVWIHGGGFFFGAASQFNPVPLVSTGDVIVVTINYRLGLFGFFTMNDPLLSGNYGVWDMIEAIRWVQNNIAAFGGNPNSVTIFGESAGGMAVSLLTLIPSAEGLFHRAISQSGAITNYVISKRELEKKTVDLLLERTDCKGREDVAETLNCLKDIPALNLTNAITMMDLVVPLNVSIEAGGFTPSIDGELIKENLAYFKSHDDEAYRTFRSVDFMSGTLDGEGSMAYMGMSPDIQEKYDFNVTEKIPKSVLCEMFAPDFVQKTVGNVPELSKEICEFYSTTESIDAQSNKVCEFIGDSAFIVPSNIMLSVHAKDNKNVNTFQYLFTKTSPIPFGGNPPSWFKGAGHGDEVYLLFDPTYYMQLTEEQVQSLKTEKELSETVIRYWTNFAKSGNPNGENVPEWPRYDVNSKKYLIINKPIETGENLKAKATELFSRINEKGRQRLYHDEL